MLIRFYRTNQPATWLSIPLLVLCLWIPAFFTPAIHETAGGMPFYRWTIHLIGFLPPFAAILTAVILVSLGALYLNRTVNNYEVLYKKTNLPALFYSILLSSSPSCLYLHPMLFSNALLLLVIEKLFRTYKQEQAIGALFDSGFLLAIASFFHFPAIVMLPALWAGLLILRPFIWREWVASLAGLLLPYFFIGTFYAWTGSLHRFIEDDITARLPSGLLPPFNIQQHELLFPGFLLFLLLLALLKRHGNTYKNIVRTRSYQQICIFLILFGLLSLLLVKEITLPGLIAMSIPFSVFIAYYFLSGKRNWWSELLFTVMIALLIYNHTGSVWMPGRNP